VTLTVPTLPGNAMAGLSPGVIFHVTDRTIWAIYFHTGK
jgi:hypothetical protein